MDPVRAGRVAALRARVEAGEFESAFVIASEPTEAQTAEKDREVFRLAALAAAVDHDLVEDFDGFVEDLWVMVCGAFQLAPDAQESTSEAPLSSWGEADGPPGVR